MKRRVMTAGVLVGMWAAVFAPTQANVDLRLIGEPEGCASRTLDVSLYAFSDDQTNQSIAAMDVILAWDPQSLQLQGIDNMGPYPYGWLFSGFQYDHALDGLNDTWSDGNALYTALSQLGGLPAYATPDGLLVTTFLFRKLRVGTPTVVQMLQTFGNYSETVVYDGETPGLDVTGTLTPATVVPEATGDVNCDGVVGFGDINPFVLLLSNPGAWQAQFPGCDPANGDINCDGQVGFADINPFVALLAS